MRSAWLLPHVFSLSGEHLREVRGDWCAPSFCCSVEDRIYLVEEGSEGSEEINEEAGLRIFVLTPTGETMQVYKPTDLTDDIGPICPFGERLIVNADLTGLETGAGLLALEGI